ncbi:MAG: endonuclease/exonuclease/phosphatase family protein, partial [bacterium]
MRYFIFWLIYIIVSSGISYGQNIKIATYNIYFLDNGISIARKNNLQSVIKQLDADIIGFQEINNPAALRNILTEDYDIAMIDDPNEVQEVALAVRLPLKIKSYKYVFPDSIYDNAFPRKRDLLQVTVEGYDKGFVLLVHYARSRTGGRLNTDKRREAASMLILDYIKSNLLEKNIILLGDFNDNPDDRSLNILEYGDKYVKGGIDTEEDSFLFNTTEHLLQKDICSYDYFMIYKDIVSDRFDPIVKGSR